MTPKTEPVQVVEPKRKKSVRKVQNPLEKIAGKYGGEDWEAIKTRQIGAYRLNASSTR